VEYSTVAPAGLNKHVESRLAAMRKAMLAGFEGGEHLSSASKGSEREAFVKGFLSQVFSPAYRFDTGDITGDSDKRSGQVDIVVESPSWYSLPMHPSGARLYMAEGVAAVIEVKSNLAGQWDEVLETTARVKTLRRSVSPQALGRDGTFDEYNGTDLNHGRTRGLTSSRLVGGFDR
jgi:hypothetical protein